MPNTTKCLTTNDHSRDSAGMTYVYPVISRRSAGVSIGINLNPNNACNWRCIYCQVPDLKRGSAPKIDLIRLEQELRILLQELLEGDFMAQKVPPECQRINDIALSGNGEPTSAKEFAEVVETIARVKRDLALPESIKLVLITNGSLINRKTVQEGIARMASLNGEVWFKFDSALAQRRLLINNASISNTTILRHLHLSASLCSTWIQTCVFKIDGEPVSGEEIDAYLNFLRTALQQGIKLQGVLLYGLARPSLQAESSRLSNVTEDWMEEFADAIRSLNIEVKVHP